MKKKLSLLIVAFMALAAYAGLNAWRAAEKTVTDELTWQGLGLNGTNQSYSDFSGKTFTSDAVYAGNAASNKGTVIQFRAQSGCGIITTKSGGKIKKILVEWNSTSANGRTLDIYGSDEPYSTAADLYGSNKGTKIGSIVCGTSTELVVEGDYAYVGMRSASSSMYFNKISIVWETESGEGETGDTKTVYLKPDVWNADGARFAAYLFKNGEDTWVDFSSTPGADGSTGTYFKAEIPTSYTGMILVRMKSGTTENNWDNKWNQTDDIDISELADKTLYRITGWGSGSNSPYDTTTWPEQSTDPDPQPEQVTWTVAGSNEALFGTAWAPALEANDMTLEDGVYKWEKENVTLLAGDVEFKVVKNHSWDESYPESNYVQSIEVGGIYTFTITFNAETKDIRVTAVKTGGISTIGELNALADKTAFTFFGDAVVVAKPADKYVYIADERGGSLIYDKNSVGTGAAEIGKTIATPWSGTVSIYNGLFEAIPTAALAVKDGDPVQVKYQEVDATYLTASNVNKVVKMNGLTITAINSKNITFKQGDAEVAGYNQFGLQLSADQVGKTYDVVGAIGRYNDKIQFQPISMEEVATPVAINSMYIVGELTGGWPDTEAGDWSMAKEMTKSADNANIWTLTVADFEAEAKEYKYKATANGKYGDYELPKEGDQKYPFTEAGKYNLLFTANTEKHELTLEAKKVEEPTNDTWTVAGSPKSIFGQTWAISSEANNLSKGEGNVWSKTYTDKVVPKGNVYYAVFKNHGAEEYYPATLNKDDLEGTAEKLTIEATGKYEVTFTFNSETHALSAAANKTGDYTINSYVVNGNSGELFSGDLRLVQSGDGIWTGAIAGKQLSAGTINFSAKANGEDFISYDGSLTIAEAGKYDVTFTLNEAEGKLVAEAKPTPVETPETFAIVGELTGGWPEEGTVDKAVMTKQDNGLYVCEVEKFTAEAKTYKYKLRANNKYGVFDLPKDGDQEWTVKEAGDYKLIFTANVTGEEILGVGPYTLILNEEKIQQPEPTLTGISIKGGTGSEWTEPFELILTAPTEEGGTEYIISDKQIKANTEFKVVAKYDNDSEKYLSPASEGKFLVDANQLDKALSLAENNPNMYFKQSGKFSFAVKNDLSTLTISGIFDEEPPTPEAHTYTIAGDAPIANGRSWAVDAEENLMTRDAEDSNKYTLHIEGAKLEAGTYGYKVVVDKSWNNQSIPKGDDAKLAISVDGIYDIDYTLTLGEADGELGTVEAVATKTGDVTFTKQYIVAGSENLTGYNWDASGEHNLMTDNGDGTWSLKYENKEMAASDAENPYKYKVVILTYADGEKISDNWRPNDDQVIEIREAGKYNVTISYKPETDEVSHNVAKAEEPVTEDTWTVAGAFYYMEEGKEDATMLPIFGNAWDASLTENDMKKDDDGIFYYRKADVELPAAGNIQLKVVKNHSWDEGSYPEEENVNVEVKIDAAGKYDVMVSFNPETKAITAGVDPKDTPEPPTLTGVSIKGAKNGDWKEQSFEWPLTAPTGEETNYVLTEQSIEANTEFKVVAKFDNDTEVWFSPASNDKFLVTEEQLGKALELGIDNPNMYFNKAGKFSFAVKYDASELTITGKFDEEPVTEATWTVAGDNTTLFGEAWKPELTANDMVKQEDGTYKWEKTEQTLTAGSVKFKVAKNHAWDEAYPSSDYVLNISENGKYTVTITFDPEKKEVGATVTKTGEAPEKEVIVDDETSLDTNETLEVETPFTTGEVEVEDGEIITIDAHEVETPARHGAFRALAADDIAIKYKPTAESDWTPAEVTIETTETGYQFEVNGDLATAINARGFAIEAKKPIVVTEIAVVTTEPDPEPEPVYYAVGVKALWGSEWAVDEANKLTLNGEGKYTITKTGLTLDANTNYGYKVVKVVGETQTWIPDGMGNEKNLTVSERAVYSVTLTLDPAEPISVDSYLAVASKTGEAEPAEDATISKVEIRGSFNDWGATGVELAKEGETNTYVGVLDLTELTADQNIKLVVNSDKWLNYDQMTVEAPDGWVTMSADEYKNIYLKNSTTGYKTYTMTATWTPSPDAAAGWTLTIAGKDERPAVPATITKVELRGEFTNWSDGEGIALTKQGEEYKYTGVLDLSEITADQAFKLVLNDKTFWLDYNHIVLEAPEGWLSKEAGDVTEPAIILANSSTGYKTYDITATWTPSSDAAAGWTLTIAGKDVRPAAEDTYTVYGAFYDGEGEHASILTKTWDPTATENDMVKGEDNVYTKTYADAELTAGTFQLKVAKNHNDATSYPEGYGVNYELPIAAAGKYDVVVTFNADTKEVSAVATPKDVPEANYYIVGTMTEWNVKAEDAYKLTLNADAQAGIVEYKITLDLEANAEFKVVKVQGESQTWYPDGMDNNYKITKTSNYTVYFRPNGDGGDDWHYHYIYVQDNDPTGINAVKAALKNAEVYTINGQRVQNPTKGLYIVNGRKVVVK